MKKYIFLTIVLSLFVTKASAYDISVVNTDGVTILYNYINDGAELAVTNSQSYSYSGSIIIPEEVTYMNRTRKVTTIEESAFCYCYSLTSITIPNSVTSIGDNAFRNCSGLTSVSIPNSVTSIGEGAFFECYSLTSITIPNSVTSIGDNAFSRCRGLTSITIPNSVTSIGESTFSRCSGLTSIIIPNSVTSIGDNAFANCSSLTSVTIPNSVTSIGNSAFKDCSMTSITIPNSVTSIGNSAFSGCSMTSVTIPNSVTSIGNSAFKDCFNLTSVSIPNSVTSIGDYAFFGKDIPEVISKIENPFDISTTTFTNNTFLNATLYVPAGAIDKYKAIGGWKNFAFIEEGNGGNTPEPKKCEKPTISYSNGKLIFNCKTEGATCQSTIIDTDISSYNSNEVQLGATYNISVYATKAGYENSDVATAALCWIDVEPKTEGIENSVAQIRANPVLVQSHNGQITVTGVNNGTNIAVFSASGQMVANERANGNESTLPTNFRRGEIAIIKIGEKSVKIVIQ